MKPRPGLHRRSGTAVWTGSRVDMALLEVRDRNLLINCIGVAM